MTDYIIVLTIMFGLAGIIAVMAVWNNFLKERYWRWRMR